MYLTLNTIIYDDELKNIEEIIRKVKGKVDAREVVSMFLARYSWSSPIGIVDLNPSSI